MSAKKRAATSEPSAGDHDFETEYAHAENIAAVFVALTSARAEVVCDDQENALWCALYDLSRNLYKSLRILNDEYVTIANKLYDIEHAAAARGAQ